MLISYKMSQQVLDLKFLKCVKCVKKGELDCFARMSTNFHEFFVFCVFAFISKTCCDIPVIRICLQKSEKIQNRRENMDGGY